jgi:hypothetical protein
MTGNSKPKGNLIPPKKLTNTHKYLMSLVPRDWAVRLKDSPEPKNIKAARRLIEVWDKTEDLRKAKHAAKWRTERAVVIDAIYFKEPEIARRLVQELRDTYGVKDGE